MIQYRDEIAVARTLAEFATALRSTSDDETFIEAIERTSVATAYYSLYHFLLPIAVPRGFVERQGSVHTRLWQWLMNIDPGLGRRCSGIYKARLTAHYKLQARWTLDPVAFVDDVVAVAQLVSQAVADYDQRSAEPPKP